MHVMCKYVEGTLYILEYILSIILPTDSTCYLHCYLLLERNYGYDISIVNDFDDTA